MRVFCPAKLNLFLNVLSYDDNRSKHNLKLVNQTINLYDELIIEKSGDRKIKILTDGTIPVDGRNSVYRACELFFKYNNIDEGVRVKIIKNIPLEAGLGGESTDAAGALMGLNKIFDTGLSLDELASIGIMIGSDVPFFIYSGYKLVLSIGDVVNKLDNNPFSNYIVIKPDFGLSTKEMFERIDKLPFYERKYVGKLYNDFMRVVPEEVLLLKDFLNDLGVSNHSLSGSGSAYFVSSSDLNLVSVIRKRFPSYQVFVCENCSGFIFKN